MAVKKSDWAIRDEKKLMLARVNEIKNKYRLLDDAFFTLSQNPTVLAAAIKKYSAELKKPIMRFFVGDVLEKTVKQAHANFLKSIQSYIESGALKVGRDVTQQLLTSLRSSLITNIDELLRGAENSLLARAREMRQTAIEDATPFSAINAQLDLTQVKIETLAANTFAGKNEKQIQRAWADLTAKYGSRETVKYRDGKNYPLNTYLDGRANTNSSDIHRLTTQLDATLNGVYTGKISSHGATDSCRQWEGKIVFFSPEARSQFTARYPQSGSWSTVDELKNNSSTHLWKFNCRHIVTPYPVQFFDQSEITDVIKEQAA